MIRYRCQQGEQELPAESPAGICPCCVGGLDRNPSPNALAIVPQVCEAPQVAHDEGIIHRDLKPEKFLLDKRGRVEIADFGLAKLRISAGECTSPHEPRRTL